MHFPDKLCICLQNYCIFKKLCVHSERNFAFSCKSIAFYRITLSSLEKVLRFNDKPCIHMGYICAFLQKCCFPPRNFTFAREHKCFASESFTGLQAILHLPTKHLHSLATLLCCSKRTYVLSESICGFLQRNIISITVALKCHFTTMSI